MWLWVATVCLCLFRIMCLKTHFGTRTLDKSPITTETTAEEDESHWHPPETTGPRFTLAGSHWPNSQPMGCLQMPPLHFDLWLILELLENSHCERGTFVVLFFTVSDQRAGLLTVSGVSVHWPRPAPPWTWAVRSPACVVHIPRVGRTCCSALTQCEGAPTNVASN